MSTIFKYLFLLLFSITLFAGSDDNVTQTTRSFGSENNTTKTPIDADSSTVTQTTYTSGNDSNSTTTSYVVSSDNNSTETTYLVSDDSNFTKISKPVDGDISITYEGQVYHCNKEDMIEEDVNGTKVYHCPTARNKQLENSTDERGTAETERLKAEVKAEAEGVKQVVLIESNVSDDGKKWVPFYYTQKVVKKVFPAKLYLSLRYGAMYQDSNVSLVDNGTRGGLFYYHQFENELELMYHYEATVSFSGLDQVFGSGSQTDDGNNYVSFSSRLNYFSLNRKEYSMFIGKYWGVYYDIAGMTDKFIAFGALGDGAFNAGTDGGGSGTGRASDMLQLRFSKSDFNVGLQVQAHQAFFSIQSDEYYDYCFGGSLFYRGLKSGVKVGVAMNYATYIDSSALSDRGIDGNDYAFVAGLSYQKNDISLDLTAAYTTNHITDDAGYFFTSIGSELYTRYRVNDPVRLTFGFNFLQPHDENYIGEYDVEDYIASAQYGFDKRFDKMVYVEGKVSRGHQADGSETSNAITVGFRYLLDY